VYFGFIYDLYMFRKCDYLFFILFLPIIVQHFMLVFFSSSSSSSENYCIYQTCEEFLIIVPSSECNTACNTLHSLGEITDRTTCKSRTFVLAHFTVCHVYKTPESVTIGDYFSICYKPAIETPLIRCSNETSKYNDIY
jgi:hypothetical protein